MRLVEGFHLSQANFRYKGRKNIWDFCYLCMTFFKEKTFFLYMCIKIPYMRMKKRKQHSCCVEKDATQWLFIACGKAVVGAVAGTDGYGVSGIVMESASVMLESVSVMLESDVGCIEWPSEISTGPVEISTQSSEISRGAFGKKAGPSTVFLLRLVCFLLRREWKRVATGIW